MAKANMRTFRVRRASGAVSAVVGTILLVAITIVLAAVLYVAMGGLMVETPVKETQMIMDAGNWQNGSVVISILAIQNAQGLAPSNLNFVVQAQNGSIYYSGAAGGNQTLVANITINITYQDIGSPNLVSTDDLIVVQVTPIDSVEARTSQLKVLSGSHVIGSIPSLS